MNVETMIYIYLVVCISLIIFNTVYIFVFRRQDSRVRRASYIFQRTVEQQLNGIAKGVLPDEEHCKFLFRKLKRTGNMMAFDDTLTVLRILEAESVSLYLDHVYPVFFQLISEYEKKGETLVIYYLYILRKHRILCGKPSDQIRSVVLPMVRSENVYCRENALQVLYSTGDPDLVVEALTLLDLDGCKHNGKLLTDGLLEYREDHMILAEKIWARFDSFSAPMQLALLNFFRFCSEDHKDRFLQLMQDETRDDELRFSCIRYFGKYPDQRAYPVLMQFAVVSEQLRWEYAAIACASLGAYPSEETIAMLKRDLHSENWYIRYNAAQSLETIGFDYLDMIDVFEGDDRYAREMIQYRLDQRRQKQEAKQCTTV